MTSEFTTSTRTHTMTLYGIREEQPGSRWQALHDVTRDAYHRWYLSEGAAARPDLGTCRRMLAHVHARARPGMGAPRGACRG